jgi:hypothetical protein
LIDGTTTTRKFSSSLSSVHFFLLFCAREGRRISCSSLSLSSLLFSSLLFSSLLDDDDVDDDALLFFFFCEDSLFESREQRDALLSFF